MLCQVMPGYVLLASCDAPRSISWTRSKKTGSNWDGTVGKDQARGPGEKWRELGTYPSMRKDVIDWLDWLDWLDMDINVDFSCIKKESPEKSHNDHTSRLHQATWILLDRSSRWLLPGAKSIFSRPASQKSLLINDISPLRQPGDGSFRNLSEGDKSVRCWRVMPWPNSLKPPWWCWEKWSF